MTQSDPGAVGNGYTEEELNIEITNLVKKHLSEYARVDVYDTSRNAYKDVQNGSFSIGTYGYVMEFHFNAFNGSATGTECYVVTTEAGITVEQAVMKELSAFFRLRDNDDIYDGVKRTNFSVISKVKSLGMSAALYEICFMDNPSELAIYQENKDEIAKAITRGVCTGFGLSAQGDEDSSDSNTGSEVTPDNIQSLIDIMAYEVIRGEHGNGHGTREASLKAKYGNDIEYQAVRTRVNEILSGSTPSALPSIMDLAYEVIRGEHGNGHATREASLIAKYGTGINYEAIRAKVNELLS